MKFVKLAISVSEAELISSLLFKKLNLNSEFLDSSIFGESVDSFIQRENCKLASLIELISCSLQDVPFEIEEAKNSINK